jgi:hypothetical protein
VSGKHTHPERTDQEFWNALDSWEPEPVSLDFNRRLYERIRNFEKSRVPRQYIPVLFALLVSIFCFTAVSRRTAPAGAVESKWTESALCSSQIPNDGQTVAQTLADLKMLSELQGRDAAL